MKLFPFDDMLGPLPPPVYRVRVSATEYYLEALIASEGWVPIAKRSDRRWISFYENLEIEDHGDGNIGIYEIKD